MTACRYALRLRGHGRSINPASFTSEGSFYKCPRASETSKNLFRACQHQVLLNTLQLTVLLRGPRVQLCIEFDWLKIDSTARRAVSVKLEPRDIKLF